MYDPIVEEIRRIRDEQAARLGYNVRAIVEDSQKREQSSGHEVVSFSESSSNADNQSAE
jgi:hypothetical protein